MLVEGLYGDDDPGQNEPPENNTGQAAIPEDDIPC
jgi:hypothetical protein